MLLTLRYALQTEVGLRGNNEDAAFAGPRLIAVSRANAAIRERVEDDPEVEGMGTTLTALLFEDRRVGVAHVGDSRAYLLRDSSLTQITKDDTVVQSLVDEGRLTPQEALNHPQRSVVLKVLTGRPVEASFEIREVDAGDRYLICSDGVSDYVPPEAIADSLRIPDAQGCPQQLIRLALQHGSHDNITCIVAEVVEGASRYNIAIAIGAPGSRAMMLPA